jgi:MFS family permease
MPESKRPGILMTLANKVVNLGVLRRKDVRIVAIIGFVCVFAFLVPFYFLPTYALFIGLSRSQAAAVTGIMSGINAVGRVVFGQLAIPFGSINMLFVSSAITCLSLCLIWPFSTTFGSLLVFAIIHGFASGGFITLLTVVAAECSTLEDMSDTLGLTYSMAIFGQLFGPSIFASILNSTGGTSYLPSQLYCAAMYAVGLIFMVWLRLTKSKQLCSRV